MSYEGSFCKAAIRKFRSDSEDIGGGRMKKSGFLLVAVVSLFNLVMGPFVADALATSEIIFKPGPGKR